MGQAPARAIRLLWKVNRPSSFARQFLQIGIRIDREPMPRKRQHVGIPSRIAESGINALVCTPRAEPVVCRDRMVSESVGPSRSHL